MGKLIGVPNHIRLSPLNVISFLIILYALDNRAVGGFYFPIKLCVVFEFDQDFPVLRFNFFSLIVARNIFVGRRHGAITGVAFLAIGIEITEQ